MGRTSGTPGRSVQTAEACRPEDQMQQVHYLGYLIGVAGVQPLPEKLEAIKKLLAPTNIDELHQFTFMLTLLIVLLNCLGKGN